MATPDKNAGLLFVYGEPGSSVTEQEFNDWYDNEHAPARMALSSISSAARYKTTDGKPPSWLAIYDTTVPNIYDDDGFKALGAKASANEKSIVSRLAQLNRRLYSPITTLEKPGLNKTTAAKVVFVACLRPTPENDDDLNKWYAEEHLELLSKVPGFLRARRFRLISQTELGGKAEASSAQAAHPYLTLYDWETSGFLDEPSFKEAIETPWSQKVLGATINNELRAFTLHKSFQK